MSIPEEMQAIIYHQRGDQAVNTIALPKLRPGYLLVKVEYVALNPTDFKHAYTGRAATPFSILGCDYAGTVVAIGADVTKPFRVGEKVYGCAHGGNFEESYDGAFAEYAMVKGDVALHAPTNSALGLDDLCTIPLGSITVGQGLFQPGKGLGLAWPGAEKDGNGQWVFVYGGSTASGTLGIQFAKMAGYKVVTTCSPSNNELVRSLGADEVFDYHDSSCGIKIRQLTNNTLKYAWDTIGWFGSPQICGDALSDDPSFVTHYSSILSSQCPREDVKSTATLMYTAFGEHFTKYGKDFPASEEDYEFGKSWMNLTEKVVAEGKLKPHPKRLGNGGLEGVLQGLEEMKARKVSGEKLVYRI